VRLRGELGALRNELRIVNRLIEHGAAYYQGWAKLLGAAAGGYMPTGRGGAHRSTDEWTASVSLRG